MLTVRKGICAVVYRKRGKKKEFLVLHRVLHWKGWEFPKGGARKNETQLQNLKRELMEELGIIVFEKIKKTPAVQVFDDFIRQKKHVNQAFLVQIPANSKISVSKNKCREHSSFKWVSARQALKLLTFKAQKKVFRKALKILK